MSNLLSKMFSCGLCSQELCMQPSAAKLEFHLQMKCLETYFYVHYWECNFYR